MEGNLFAALSLLALTALFVAILHRNLFIMGVTFAVWVLCVHAAATDLTEIQQLGHLFGSIAVIIIAVYRANKDRDFLKV